MTSGVSAADAMNQQQDAGMAVLRQSLDTEQAVALELVQAMAPQPQNPGSHVDIGV